MRPLGTARLEVALGAAHANGDDWDRLVPRARVSVTLIDGLRLYGEGENVPRGTGATFGDGSDTRLAFGMAIDFDHLGAVVGVPILLAMPCHESKRRHCSSSAATMTLSSS